VAGQVIEEADVAALRPVGSLGAEYARVLIGCRAPRDMAAGSPFEPLDLGTRRPGGLA